MFPIRLPLVLLAVLATSAIAQEKRPVAAGSADAAWHFRHELFQMLLEERGLTMEATLDAALAAPEESVIVMFGRVNRFQVADSGKLMPFVAKGGTVLVASDRSGTMGVIASFISGPIASNDAETQYQNLSDCLRITDLDRDHFLMSGVNELIVNRSGWLAFLPDSSMNWKVVATSPQTCLMRRSRGQPLIAVSQRDEPEAGTMIVAADPSLFTNSMLWHGDNAIFAIRVSEMLCRGEKRRLVFMTDGQPLPSYRSSPLLQENNTPSPQQSPPPPMPPLPRTPPKPTWEQLLRVANSVIQNVEESNILNEAVSNHPRYPNRRLYPLVIALGLAAVTAAWLYSKLWHTAAVSPPLPEIRDMQTAKEIDEAVTDESLGYGAAAQTLARDLCREMSAGCDLPPEWPHCSGATAVFPVWTGLTPSQRRDLTTVVELAARPHAPHISPRRLRQLGGMIQKLRDLHRATLLIT